MTAPEQPTDPDDAPMQNADDLDDQEADWADLEALGVPYVEPEPQQHPRRGLHTAVALGVAALVVAGGVAVVVVPHVGDAFAKGEPAPSSGPTLIPDEELAATTSAPPSKAKKSPRAKPTPSATTEVASQPDVSRMVDAAWVTDMAQKAGIPERALSAYAGASLRVQQLRPSCKLGWNTLAAIGSVESHHGAIDNNTLGSDGLVRPGIRGVALDGGDKVAAIKDTDHGKLDGDTVWDRAVGPMQFIPATWEKVKLDGNADGVADVQQIDDAALSAGVHLCDVGGDLTVHENWIRAVKSYNPSLKYNNDVAGIAANFADLN